MSGRSGRAATLAAALLILNISLTFTNLWPTPAIGWDGELSIEVAACVLAFAVAGQWWRRPSRLTLGLLSALWAVLIVGRYASVTAEALYGRDINLYWDLRYIPDVAAMVGAATPVWLIAAAIVVIVGVFLLLFMLIRWALERVAAAVTIRGERGFVGLLAAAVVVLFLVQHLSARAPAVPVFSAPVTATYAQQVRFILDARSGANGASALATTPPLVSDLSLVKDADVLLVFIESYGAVSYDRPELSRPLEPRRAELAAGIRATGRDVVSAFVESPTFGGSSWLAHISLLSGVEVRDPGAYALLMTEKRDTMVTAFSRRGFRTLAVMPGLKKRWPEGSFYGFDQIYDADRLDYQGPWFGWFGLPDEFTLARIDNLEVNRPSRAPLFMFLPTLSTHFPFGPTPPYQADWKRVLTNEPYDSENLYPALEAEPDWTDFAPSYVKAVSYAYQSIEGYLKLRSDRNLVMILIGDHQPPGAVAGGHQPWDVPVHVIASNREVLDRLRARGFQPGLAPVHPAISPMHALLPVLLGAFGNP